jgi:uncharacterized integral membrane protein (TIGR00697 family)
MQKQLGSERILGNITMVYVVLLILSNVMASRLINVGGFILDAGNIVYPLLFMVGDVLSDTFGYKTSRKVILKGFLMNFVFVSFSWIGTYLPRLADDAITQGYDVLFGYNLRIVAASFICYLLGSLLNAGSLVVIKKITGGKWFAVRTIGSTVLGAFVDTFLFSILAWIGTIPFSDIMVMAITTYVAKLIYECCIATPVAYKLRYRISKYEIREG